MSRICSKICSTKWGGKFYKRNPSEFLKSSQFCSKKCEGGGGTFTKEILFERNLWKTQDFAQKSEGGSGLQRRVTEQPIPLLPCRPRAPGGGLSIYSLCLFVTWWHNRGGLLVLDVLPPTSSSGSVQLGRGILPHHDRYRICPDVLWDSAPYRICPAYYSSWGINKSCPAMMARALYNLEYVQFHKKLGTLKLWAEYIQLLQSWGILSVGSFLLGWDTLPYHDKYRICPDVLWESIPYRICPAYNTNWGIQQNLSSRWKQGHSII